MIEPVGNQLLVYEPKERIEPGKLFIPKAKDDPAKTLCICKLPRNMKEEYPFQLSQQIFLKPYANSIKTHEDTQNIYHLISKDDVVGVYLDK